MRLTAVNGLLFVVILLLLAFSYYLTSNRVRQNEIRDYDAALNVLYGVFSEKQTGFPSTLSALFDSAGAQYTIRDALVLPSLAPETSEKLASLFSDICSTDYDVVGVLLHSYVTNKLYSFSTTLPVISEIAEFGELQPEGKSVRMLLGEDEIRAFCGGSWHDVYAMTGTLGEEGRIVIVYSSSSLSALMSRYGFGADAEYAITTARGSVLYGGRRRMEQSVANRISNDRYRFNVSYEIDGNKLRESASFLLPLHAISGLCIYIVMLGLSEMYARISRRRVLIIEDGLRKISDTDFGYRIPEDGKADEFSSIIHSINSMSERLRQNIALKFIYAAQQKNAELYALQTSINPHFLGNMLESVRARISTGAFKDAEVMLTLLAKMYRGVIRQEMFASIMEEIDHCDMFFEIYQLQFENFDYATDVPGEFLEYGLPRSTLQPIIENYFVHGIDPARAYNQIAISAQWRLEGGKRMIVLSVKNDGITPTNEELLGIQERLSAPELYRDDRTDGFGLPNVNSRLKLVFGDEYGLRVSASDGGGFTTEIWAPPLRPSELLAKYARLGAQGTDAAGGGNV